MAVFDHRFQGKPQRPPLATLAWKDWKDQGQGPQIRRLGEPSSILPPRAVGSALARFPPAPAVGRRARTAVAPRAPRPLRRRSSRPSSLRLRPAPLAAVPAPAPLVPSVPPRRAGAAGRRRCRRPPPRASCSQSRLRRVAAAPAAPDACRCACAGSRFPRCRANRGSIPSVPGSRLSGDELITDLFEAMHDLHFLRDSLEGADFVLALVMDKLPSAVALVHFYDINAREFVVVRAVGPGAREGAASRAPPRKSRSSPRRCASGARWSSPTRPATARRTVAGR